MSCWKLKSHIKILFLLTTKITGSCWLPNVSVKHSGHVRHMNTTPAEIHLEIHILILAQKSLWSYAQPLTFIRLWESQVEATENKKAVLHWRFEPCFIFWRKFDVSLRDCNNGTYCLFLFFMVRYDDSNYDLFST